MHIFGSFFVLAGLYGYYLIKLLWAEHPMLFVHLALPMAAAFATRYASYGGWQKLMILAFVLEINTQHFLLSREITAAPEASPRPAGAARRRRLSSRAPH